MAVSCACHIDVLYICVVIVSVVLSICTFALSVILIGIYFLLCSSDILVLIFIFHLQLREHCVISPPCVCVVCFITSAFDLHATQSQEWYGIFDL